MRTRTKLALGAGLLAVAVGVVLATRPKAVQVRFVRYGFGNSVATLEITNRTDSAVLCGLGGNLQQEVGEGGQIVYSMYGGRFMRLEGHRNCRTEVSGIRPSSRLCMQYQPEIPGLQQRIIGLLRKAGIDIADPDVVVTVDLPPIATNAPAQPVTP